MLIVFSVLFALFINKMAADARENKDVRIAKESIRQELEQNAWVLKRWKKQHIEIRNRLTGILEGKNDSLKNELLQYEFLNLGVLTGNQSLMDAFLTDTAWESAKTTGILSAFDFETTQQLTRVYTLQRVLTTRTLSQILDLYFDRSAHDMADLNQTLIQFQLRFWELTGQEELMVQLFDEALTALNPNP